MRCVPAEDFNVSKAVAWRTAIGDDPPYQRKGSIWSLPKQQRFIDSLLNGYDVPKFYLHDLRGRHPTRVYAVVDGKQRLTTIWRYLGDEFPLADEFKIDVRNLPELPDGVPHPRAGQCFSELDPAWQRVLRTTHLAVVLIQNATEEDIQELFSRLNNGEPLNAAEKRNAMGGDATKLVRAIAGHPFFAQRVRFTNARYHHHDVAARLLAIESALDSGTRPPDLRSRSLDGFIRDNRRIAPARRRDLRERVTTVLERMCEVFEAHDVVLTSQASVPLQYLVVRSVAAEPPDGWAGALREALAAFEKDRRAQLGRSEAEQDAELREFSELMHSGVNRERSLSRRLMILLRRLRASGPILADALQPEVLRAGASRPSRPELRSHVHSTT